LNVRMHDCQTSTLRTRTEMVFKTMVCSPLNHLTRLRARETSSYSVAGKATNLTY